jgi:hypothetical protein
MTADKDSAAPNGGTARVTASPPLTIRNEVGQGPAIRELPPTAWTSSGPRQAIQAHAGSLGRRQMRAITPGAGDA